MVMVHRIQPNLSPPSSIVERELDVARLWVIILNHNDDITYNIVVVVQLL